MHVISALQVLLHARGKMKSFMLCTWCWTRLFSTGNSAPLEFQDDKEIGILALIHLEGDTSCEEWTVNHRLEMLPCISSRRYFWHGAENVSEPMNRPPPASARVKSCSRCFPSFSGKNLEFQSDHVHLPPFYHGNCGTAAAFKSLSP